MAQNSTNTIYGLSGFRDHLALWLGQAAYSTLDTSDKTFLNDAIEMGIDQIGAEADWAFTKNVTQGLTVLPTYTTGTVAVTNLSETVTGTGTGWDTAMDSSTLAALTDVFNVSGYASYARLATYASGTSITLESEFAGTTATGASYTVGRDRYLLNDGVWDVKQVEDTKNGAIIPVVPMAELEARATGGFQTGNPQYCALGHATPDTSSGTGTRQYLQFWPIPSATVSYRIRYTAVPTFPTNNFELAIHMMELLLHRVLVQWWAMKAEFERSQFHEARYQQLLPLFKKRDQQRARTKIRMRKQFGGPIEPQVWLNETITDA